MNRLDLNGVAHRVPKLSIITWGCITSNGVGNLYMTDENINSVHYEQIMDENLWPVILKEFPTGDCIFQQDNCSVHTAHIIRDYLQREDIRTLPWPAKSPDLNIIGNLWFILKFEIKRNIDSIKNLQNQESLLSDCSAGIQRPCIF